MDIQTKGQVGDLAAARFSRVQQDIDRVKDGIEFNRKGELPLASIQGDPSKLAKRIAREGLPIQQALERINGIANFQDVVILKKMLRLAASVCRITICNDYGSSGYGTGFLIAPDLIITNHHVFPDEASAKNSFVHFFYELNENGGTNDVLQFKLRPDKFFQTSDINKQANDPHSGLDFTIVAVEQTSIEGHSITDLTPIRLDAGLGKIIEGENCIVIQHPQGDYKKIVLKDIRMLTLTDNHLIYESDTLPGSSGSMVVGLGTGEVVALHHSGVPRTNDQGQWLKKDGTVATQDDSDDAIDWIGNEGIRVSCILKAIDGIPVKDEMNVYKEQLLQGHITVTPSNTNATPNPASDKATAPQQIPVAAPTPAGLAKLLYFEITLSASKPLQADWKEHAKKLVPGFKRLQVLFPFSTLPQHKRMFYLTVSSAKDPWALAAEIEAFPQVDACTPDLPMATHMQESFKVRGATESSALELGNDGTGEWNEDDFKKDWFQSFYCKDWIANSKADDYRQWNRKAINYPAALDEQTKNNLRKLKMIQLDTGYTEHTKVQGSYDFVNDADFVDGGDDARDELASGILKQPSHGTRTASLVTGCKIKNFQYDGNRGLLTENDKSLINLIPYRVAKSVILIGNGKNMVDAASHAINSNADVMYMCMGAYPRPMFEEIARMAYDRGVIWVCAAGNEVEMVIAPALYPGTVAVAAFNPDRRPWKGSSYGSTVDIAAPGEDVYVPFINKKGEEVMVFGSGTSYATPQVASAAMLWKARWRDELGKKYKYPWQVVEAFRLCLRNSANKDKWDTKNYGAGIMDIDALLKYPLPEIGADKYAYKDAKDAPKWDLGVREGIHFIWNTLKKKLTPGQAESFGEATLSPRAMNALAALSGSAGAKAQESTGAASYDGQNILRTYFESNQ